MDFVTMDCISFVKLSKVLQKWGDKGQWTHFCLLAKILKYFLPKTLLADRPSSGPNRKTQITQPLLEQNQIYNSIFSSHIYYICGVTRFPIDQNICSNAHMCWIRIDDTFPWDSLSSWLIRIPVEMWRANQLFLYN